MSSEGSKGNLDRREKFATTAESLEGDRTMAYAPGDTPTCNKFVAKVIVDSGGESPMVKKADGTVKEPGAAEWAKGSPVPGWRPLKAGEMPMRGDVMAIAQPGNAGWTGHCAMVVNVDGKFTTVVGSAHEMVREATYADRSKLSFQRYIGD